MRKLEKLERMIFDFAIIYACRGGMVGEEYRFRERGTDDKEKFPRFPRFIS